MSDVATQSREPSLRFMLSHPAHVISLGFGAGLAPFAPGTFGTLLGLFAARWLQPLLGDTLFFAALFGALLIGTWAAGALANAAIRRSAGHSAWSALLAPLDLLLLAGTLALALVDRARGRMVGSDQYLTKPFTKDSLLQTVATFALPAETESNT